jgi:hypothetical protein
MRIPRTRRIVALVAAYAIALQALLLPISIVHAAPDAGLCASSALQNEQPAADHTTGCPCAAGCGMQCCAGAIAAPPSTAADLAFVYSRPVALSAAVTAPRLHLRSPQLARGPPAA